MFYYATPMRSQLTFNQIVYTPDLSGCLTTEQATNLLERALPRAEVLAGRIVDELNWNQLQPVDRARPLSMSTAVALVASHGQNRDGDRLCVGTVDYRAAYAGSAMSVALQWWWVNDELRVGRWPVR